ncbi:hypothetical protein [Cypionkella sinensis]|uniref:Site-specific DNA-methyltransferase n=1 Tax=Cypionkella sinensis TaxID=1756043 RepID=A0ABV7J3E1_9RHOB
MAKKPIEVETLTHDATRKNIPTAEFESIMREQDKTPIQLAYERRNRDLDPQLVWRGKDEQDWSDLIVQAPPLYIQEKVHPKVIIDDLKRESANRAKATKDAPQFDMFADFNGLPDAEAATEFYQHDQHWSNRMISGDSLSVMASLAEREGLRGQVQCIYFDPPYGIKFNSNFQWSTTSRDVKDARYPFYLLADSVDGQRKEGEITRTPPKSNPTQGSIRQGFVYERVPHITLKSIANNAEIDVIWDRLQPAVEDAVATLNAALSGHPTPFKVETGGRAGAKIDFRATGGVKLLSGEMAPAGGLMEWEIPREAPSDWPATAQSALRTFWTARITGAGNLFVIFGEPDIRIADAGDGLVTVQVFGVDVFKPQTGSVESEGTDGIALWMLDTDYNEESFFVRHAYFLGANDPYKALKTTLKAEIDEEAWESLYSDTSRPFAKPQSGRIAVKVINHLGDEVMKVFAVE